LPPLGRELLLVELVGESSVGDGRLALELHGVAADFLQPLVDLGVDARHEE
jgi:hypothetical protein